MSIVAVVMAAPTTESRMADATALLNYGFANFAVFTPPEGLLAPVPVSRDRKSTVQPRLAGGISVAVDRVRLAENEAQG